MKFLYAAYIVTWVVHLGYLTVLRRGYKHLHEDAQEK